MPLERVVERNVSRLRDRIARRSHVPHSVRPQVAIAAAPGGDPRTLELRAPTREARDAWCETLRYVIGIASAR
jgi:hypothetical protein